MQADVEFGVAELTRGGAIRSPCLVAADELLDSVESLRRRIYLIAASILEKPRTAPSPLATRSMRVNFLLSA